MHVFDQDGTFIKDLVGARVDGTYTLVDWGKDAAIGCGVIAITGVFATGSSGHLEVFDFNGNLLWRKKNPYFSLTVIYFSYFSPLVNEFQLPSFGCMTESVPHLLEKWNCTKHFCSLMHKLCLGRK